MYKQTTDTVPHHSDVGFVVNENENDLPAANFLTQMRSGAQSWPLRNAWLKGKEKDPIPVRVGRIGWMVG